MELTHDEIMELRYEAKHGDFYSQMILDDYLEQFEEIPEEFVELSIMEKIRYKKEMLALDTIYWIIQFKNDYYGEDGRFYYPVYEF